MSGDDRVHELLPWFLTRTLDSAEADAFRDHLASCPSCREEMAVLERIRDAAREHGSAFFSDHPSAERLVAAVRGELDDTEATEVRRHLALCMTCATESRWVTGERPGGEDRRQVHAEPLPPAAKTTRLWPWVAVAAALLLTAVLLPLPRPARPYTGVLTPHTLVPTQRGEQATRVTRAADRVPVPFVVEVDYPVEAFPVTVEVVSAEGRTVQRLEPVERGRLLEGLYLFFTIDPRDIPPGSYVVRVIPATGSLLPIESRFEMAAD